MKAATAKYRQDEDVLGAFLAEHCEAAHEAFVAAGDLRGMYEGFCNELGERPKSAAQLGRELKQRGFGTGKDRGKRGYTGLRLRAASEIDQDEVERLAARAQAGV